MTETVYRLPVPATVVLLADLHDRPYFSIMQSLSDHRPAIICIAGDVVFGDPPKDGRLLIQTQKYVLPFLRACSALAPTFLSLGNHEKTVCEDDLQRIRDTGCVLLDNSWVSFGGTVIGGLTSHLVLDYRRLRAEKQERYPACRHERCVITEPDIGWLEELERQPGYRILLCHHPEYYPRFLKGRDIDLILSGHAHGGQWRIGRQGIFAPSQGLFPRLTEGVHDGRLVISRGLANRTPVPRLNNPPEIVYIQPPVPGFEFDN
ncbi:MAG: metallophosphoesterase [Oscillospiraceae bacterium]|nr:metallophosphoesterase [Oscillospiraceae bacterium]